MEKLEEEKFIECYLLGIEKIISGKRGSGVSSTIIDECLKYNIVLLVKGNTRALYLKKEYPTLEVFSYKQYDISKLSQQTVSIDFDVINDVYSDIATIKENVKSIKTIGFSYEA